ncbi:hypothetical protein [Pseudoflavonifractor sp. 524-17]|uniref:hypothetical protein n=1 Tax=Pseudoflavonifractor sp. 524-17 TaxID=2304577 RepID=UPI001FABC4DD|nr:hypothetical protein [Pseudoflavonifractor sp. 524-17]
MIISETYPALSHSQPEQTTEPAGTDAPRGPEAFTAVQAEPDLTPNVEEYLNLKAAHPDKLVGVRVGGYLLFYGRDAETAAPALGTELPVRDIPGLGAVAVTGSPMAWQAVMTKLLEHGHSVVLAQPDPERDPGAPYEIIQAMDAAEYIPLGMELTMDGRRMKIDSVDFQAGTVSLLDLDMRGWFPVFRSEPVSLVREYVKEVQRSEAYIAADMAAQLRNSAAAEAPVPAVPEARTEIDGGKVTPPSAPFPTKTVGRVDTGAFEVVIEELHSGPEKHNFRITDENLGVGGEKAKYQYNAAAIRTLKQIEAENRLATPEEQEILSRYVGWGALAPAFDADNAKWANEYTELKDLLTPEEYASARATTVNAHYARFVP